MVVNRKTAPAPKAVVAAKRRLAKAATSSTTSQASSSRSPSSKAGAGAEEGEASLIEQIFDDILADTSHVVPVFALIQKRKREMADTGDDILTALTTISAKNLGSMDDDWKIDWIVKKSDVAKATLLEVYKKNRAAIDQLLQTALQLNLKRAFVDKLKYLEILELFLNRRYESLGCRLEHVKRDGAITKENTLNLKALSPYLLEFKDSVLTKIVFKPTGACAVVAANCHLGTSHKLADGLDDHAAKLLMPPMPAVPVPPFFAAEQNGPWSVASLLKSRDYEKAVEEVYAEWEITARKAIKIRAVDTQLHQEVSKVKSEEKQAVMAKARAKAKAALAARRSASLISLTE